MKKGVCSGPTKLKQRCKDWSSFGVKSTYANPRHPGRVTCCLLGTSFVFETVPKDANRPSSCLEEMSAGRPPTSSRTVASLTDMIATQIGSAKWVHSTQPVAITARPCVTLATGKQETKRRISVLPSHAKLAGFTTADWMAHRAAIYTVSPVCNCPLVYNRFHRLHGRVTAVVSTRGSLPAYFIGAYEVVQHL